MNTGRRFTCIAAAVLLLPFLFAAAPDHALSVPRLADRLAALDGSAALPYFLLGEEVASEMPDPRGRTLARTLFVIAHEIDRASPRPEGLARSVYLALAPLADRAGEREWLFALAGRTPTIEPPPATDLEASLLVSEAIAAARAGEATELKKRLADPEALPALDRLMRSAPAVFALLEHAQSDPSCPVCHNRRTMKSTTPRPGGGVEETHSLCPECRGNPGPRLRAEEFARTVAAESALLGASHESWSAELWIDRGAPFRDADPADLAAYYAVDPAARIWRPTLGSPDPAEGEWWIGPTNP